MKHRAPQFELPGTAEPFNLSGETYREMPVCQMCGASILSGQLCGPCRTAIERANQPALIPATPATKPNPAPAKSTSPRVVGWSMNDNTPITDAGLTFDGEVSFSDPRP